jgi:uncharacterized membrane protein YphA (DoxX/SURF4 family)
MQSALMSTGRVLLALYFLLPGIAKFVSWERHIALMETHEMVMVPVLLSVGWAASDCGRFAATHKSSCGGLRIGLCRDGSAHQF